MMQGSHFDSLSPGWKEYDALDGFEQVSGSCLTDVTHTVVPEIHCLSDFSEKNCLNDGTRWKNKFEIDEVQFVVCLGAFINVDTSTVWVLLNDLKLSIIEDVSDFASHSCHPPN
jgi:hypothetical protein